MTAFDLGFPNRKGVSIMIYTICSQAPGPKFKLPELLSRNLVASHVSRCPKSAGLSPSTQAV